ncbi:MAG: TolC family protein [Candidatus Omnitrophota bacterium]
MPILFLRGGKKVADIKKAKARLSESQAQERSGRDGVIYTLQETWTEWQNAMDSVSVRQNFLEAAELRARITQAQYSNGLALFDNWTIIEDGLSYDKKAYLNSMAVALIAEAYWIQAKGGTLDYDEEA